MILYNSDYALLTVDFSFSWRGPITTVNTGNLDYVHWWWDVPRYLEYYVTNICVALKVLYIEMCTSNVNYDILLKGRCLFKE